MFKLNVDLINRLVREEDGQNLIEYALVAGLLAVGAIAALTLVKTEVIALFTEVSTTLKKAL